MELSRQEYPNLLTTLQPGQAINVLNDRIKLITKINVDIADWLQERRKVEELYVTGLRKLARRPQQDAASALGIFQLPWQRIVTSTEAIAASHEVLANKIETDVERPLREYSTKNREMQSMTTVQGNLGAIARDLEKAQERSEKLKTKGGKANKVANVNSSVEDANQQWESQAPYVFEQLQSVDENRLNHLRDVLTQFQTHEADQVEKNRVVAENTLNALLNVEVADEIKTFTARMPRGRGSVPRRMSQPRRQSVGASSSANPAASLPPPVPTRSNEDGISERSGSAGGPQRLVPAAEPPMQKHSGLGGLKRLGTVIGRRKSAIPAGANSIGIPDKEKRSFRPFGRRGESEQSIPSTPSRGGLTTITSNEERPPSQLAETTSRPQPVSQPSERDLPQTPEPDAIIPASLNNQGPTTNGILANDYPVLQPTSATTPSVTDFSSSNQPRPDYQGFSAPPPATDEITRAQQEAGGDNDPMPYNLRIRDKPIQEEEDEAQKAMNEMASTLRAVSLAPLSPSLATYLSQQAQISAPTRKQGTVRGRREVRNTVFIPTGVVTADSLTESAKPFSPPTSIQTPTTATEPLALTSADRATTASDTTSIHSAQTLSANPLISHPEMLLPGLNASIVETVNAWFSAGTITKSSMLGEMALVYNPTPGVETTQTTTIRLDNFALLEKVAANPVLATPVSNSSTPGIYAVSLPQITNKPHPAIAFKYQLHLDESSLPTHSPVMLTPNWKIEPNQASVIVNYALNPSFTQISNTGSITLKNVLLTISLSPTSPAKAISALMQPEGGFRKATSTVYWKLPELTVETQVKRLIARFKTEGGGEAMPGQVGARWEINGLGSRLGVSLSEEAGRGSGESDPFADESGEKKDEGEGDGEGVWKEIRLERRLMSGKYVAE